MKATERFWLSKFGTALASLLHTLWGLRHDFIVLQYVGGHLLQPTLVQPHFLVFEPLSFPIYNIVVIIFHPRQAGLLPYVDNHSTSGPKSLEKSRGT